ncbi:beta-xylosidase-like isoform X2 [Corticium candelabrum]|uniref:beta-xylosidase-like isoform X2 n=1 Tax=Corticium candelabrum TaxID=121492 RepID=UPI002E275031|nr:beta-xylosidase-like isoform X2 [Corticium candelabrum]
MLDSLRFGRLSEGFSEEPTLSSAYARAAVAGLQGDSHGGPYSYLDDTHILSLAKHYAAYGSEAGGQNAAPAHISERTLREVYLKPWRAFAQSGGRGMMASHETIDSIPCHANSLLINDILRTEFNFTDGIAISDCNDIGVLVDYRVAQNSSHAAAKALQAGVDIDLMCGDSPDKWSYNKLHDSLNEGLITNKDIETACSRILAAKFASRLFDEPMADPSRISIINNSNHRSLAYDAAIEGLVLLKNFDETLGRPLLPLQHRRDIKSPISLAIIGPNAGCTNSSWMCDSVSNMLGPYTQHNADVEVKTVYQAAVDSLGPNYWVNFSRGCNIDDNKTDMIAAAVDTAMRSDIAILVLGDSLHSCGEWSDRDSLDLPGAQLLLLESIINVKRAPNSELENILVALVNGRPATFGPNNALLDSIDVLLVGFRPGQMGAQAIIDVLMRGVEPRGRLAQSWPRSVGQVHGAASPWLQEIRGKWIANSRSKPDPDGRIYDPYVNSPATPLFYFGYGLSFGRFNYSNPTATMTKNKEHPVEVSVTVLNTGKQPGTEVVQVYLQDPVVNHVRYWKRLVGFQKIFLLTGQSKTVNIPLRMDDIAMYDDNMKFRIVEGTYTLRFGGHSSADTFTTQISF